MIRAWPQVHFVSFSFVQPLFSFSLKTLFFILPLIPLHLLCTYMPHTLHKTQSTPTPLLHIAHDNAPSIIILRWNHDLCFSTFCLRPLDSIPSLHLLNLDSASTSLSAHYASHKGLLPYHNEIKLPEWTIGDSRWTVGAHSCLQKICHLAPTPLILICVV